MPLRSRYLGDQEEVRKAIQTVKNQVKYDRYDKKKQS